MYFVATSQHHLHHLRFRPLRNHGQVPWQEHLRGSFASGMLQSHPRGWEGVRSGGG